MKKELYLVKWLISGWSIISGRDQKDIQQQFENFELPDLQSEIETRKIAKIEKYKK